MKKIDLKKELKYLYAASARKVEIVKVPKLNFVTIDGATKPGETPQTSRDFQDAIAALYGVSFTLKFMSKLRKLNPIDFTVMALEGLWWVDSGDFDFSGSQEWRWTLMIMQPRHVTETMVRQALRTLREKNDSPFLGRVKLGPFHEGLCIQAMHIGPYSEEPSTIEKMERFAQEEGLLFRGKHHEIYCGDPRRTRPERLKTILRHPVEKGR